MTNEKSTKSLIISSLGNDFPLSLNQVSKEVRKQKNISYQAVFKVMGELVKGRIVDKIDKQYFLNKDWVDGQTKDFSRYYSNYFNINYNQNEIYPESLIQVFKFQSLREMVDFIMQGYVKGLISKTGNVYISVKRLHPLVPTSIISLLKKIATENNIYVACESNGYADKITAKLFKSLGLNTKLGADIPNRNSVCFEDCLLQYYLFFPAEYKKKVHAFSDNVKEKSGMSIIQMTADIFYRKADIYLTLIRDHVVIGDIKTKIQKEFGLAQKI